MQEERLNDFDLLVRGTMADAEEAVPSGVWKAVASRVGAAATAGVWTSLWKWTAPAMAFAAAAVALFVIPRTSEKTIVESGREVLSVRTTACAFEPSLEIADIPSIAELAPREVHSPAVFEKAVQEKQQEPVAALQGEKSISTTDEQPEIMREEPAIGEFQDPFEALYLADEGTTARGARKSRTSILVGNTLGANDTHYDNSTFGPQFASGTKAVSAVSENSVSNYGFPVSIGLGVRHQLADRLSAGFGLSWTQLSRSFNGSYKTEIGDFTHKVQYIGVPVHVYYDILDKNSLQIYAFGGGSAEKCIYNSYFLYEKSSSPLCKETVKGLQFGVDFGLGVNFKLNNTFSIYLDPAVQYWFAGVQPKTVRTEKPLLFSIEGGIRFNL